MTQAAHPSASAAGLPRLIAWEVTRSCPLACKHCRADAHLEPYPGELTTDECRRVLDNIAFFARPTMILTGGEPMLRTDIYVLAEHAHRLGLPVVMAPCGKFVDDEAVARMKKAGIHCISISIDGATAVSHDAFRGIKGAFQFAIQAAEAARRGGLDFQINTTITQHNLAELPDILRLAVRLGASVFNPFLLVPTGRGKELAGREISPEDYERTLHWLAQEEGRTDIRIRVTCAPHYTRVLHQRRLLSPVQSQPSSPERKLGVSPECPPAHACGSNYAATNRDSHLFLGGENGAGEKGSGEKGSGEKGSGEKGTGEKGSGEKGAGEKGSGEKGAGGGRSGEKGSGEKGSDPLSVQGSDPFSPECAGPARASKNRDSPLFSGGDSGPACAPGDAAAVVPPHSHPGGPGGQKGSDPLSVQGSDPFSPARGKGCLGGKAFAFISHLGKVQICGFLETECGDLKKENFDFRKIWETSSVFLAMRDVDRYHGKCGRCEYRRICGGCRARAFAMTDDYLAEEPFCIYQPR